MKTSRNIGDRRYVYWLCITLAVMYLLPFAVARLASECSGMALCMLLFFFVNPVYSAVLGYCCGSNVRRMWNLPLIAAVAFLSGAWLFFDIREAWFLVYAVAYLAIGWMAMGLARH